VFGVELTTEPFGDIGVTTGDQVYVLAPLAVKLLVLPLQITDGEATTLTTGLVVTVTTTCAELVQVPVAPITVYVSVIGVLDVTVAPLGELKLALGDHV